VKFILPSGGLCTKSHLLVSKHRRFAFADMADFKSSCVAVADFVCKAPLEGKSLFFAVQLRHLFGAIA